MVCLLLLASVSAAWPNGDFGREQAVMDSLRTVPPRQREFWLRQRGSELPGYTASQMTDSGLTLVGKWGRGPSVDVTVQDTLVALSLGSEVALLSFAQPDSPRVLSEIQLSYMAGQAQLAGNRLYINSGGSFEVWDIINPTQPVQRGRLGYGIGDFWVNDTFLYFIKADTFKAFSVANPVAMYQLGACRDSGYFLTATTNTAVLGHSSHGLYFVDITDPRNPHRAGSYSTDLPRSAAARGSLCCATVESGTYPYPIRFLTLNIANPASPSQLGSLADAGGYDLHLDGQYAFASGREFDKEVFHIISVVDSVHPAVVGSCRTTDRYNWGVWADLSQNLALVADECAGLAVVDIASPSSPQLKTWVLSAGSTVDVSVEGNICYVASDLAGLRILDVSDPTTPRYLSGLDTAFFSPVCYTVAARDSFAYTCWSPNPSFRSVNVSNPLRPQVVAGCSLGDFPQDMVLRDSFVYLARDYRFQIINVARPRSPVVVGTCNLPDYSYDLAVSDTLAFVANGPALKVISVARPNSPYVVGTWPGHTYGLDLRDTVLYAVGQRVLSTVSVANPAAPVLLDSLPLPFITHDVAVVESIAYVCGYQMQAVSVSDLMNLRTVGSPWQPPSLYVHRLVWEPPFIYAAATDGGVCILETLQTGISELPTASQPEAVHISPSISAGTFGISIGGGRRVHAIRVYDVAGNLVVPTASSSASDSEVQLDLSTEAGGVYVVTLETDKGFTTSKIVITRR